MYLFCFPKKGIWRIKAPFLRNAKLRSLSYDLTSDDSSFYRGGLYSLEEGKKEQIELKDVRKNEGYLAKEKDQLESTAVDFLRQGLHLFLPSDCLISFIGLF